MDTITKKRELADIFAEDSENERTFDGFSDSEINDNYDKVSSVRLMWRK